MFIQDLTVRNYKKLANFNLVFKKPKNRTDSIENNMNLTIIIGENGTAKTTIFQLILGIFSNQFVGDRSIDYQLNYVVEGENEKINAASRPYSGNFPVKLIVSSYTLVDKLKLTSVELERSEVQVISLETNKNIIPKMSSLLFIKNQKNSFEEVDELFQYIGFHYSSIYIEISRGIKGPSYYASRVFSKRIDNNIELQKVIDKKDEKIRHLKINKIIDLKIKDYESILMGHNSQEKHSSLSSKINAVIKSQGVHEELFAIRILVEVVYIIEKVKIFEKNFSYLNSTKYTSKRKRMISIEQAKNYIGGVEGLIEDIKFLELMDIFIFSDMWFNSLGDFIPFSMWSSGELSLFSRMLDLSEKVTDNSIVLIDEPETHLHPKWISGYITMLNKLLGDKKCHVLIATHSPLIISDVQSEMIIGLKKEKSSIVQFQLSEETLGLSYDHVLSEVFGVDEGRGEISAKYAKAILFHLDKGDFNRAFDLYNNLADSELKFDLFLKIKNHTKNEDYKDV